MDPKYIIVQRGGVIIPAVFGNSAIHKEVARAFMPGTVIGAGFVTIDERTGRFCCYGESTSLQIKSRGVEDSKLLDKHLGVDV